MGTQAFNRRNFLKGAFAAGVAAVAGSAVAGCSAPKGEGAQAASATASDEAMTAEAYAKLTWGFEGDSRDRMCGRAICKM